MAEAEAPAKTVLVLDDEPQLLRLMVRVLERAGCRVHGAASSTQALDCFRDHGGDIDAVILDMAIEPDGAGPVMSAMQGQRAEVAMVITSGDMLDPALRSELVRCGGVFLRKPFDPRALVAAVRRAGRAGHSCEDA